LLNSALNRVEMLEQELTTSKKVPFIFHDWYFTIL
jgi:hypothetical protein